MRPGDPSRVTQRIRRMHRHIRILAALGILITGLLAGLATAMPFYLAARDSIETTTRLGAEAQAVALHHELTRYADIARQLTSRSEVRMRLEQYALGELTLPALRRFTEPRLIDALDQAHDLRGLLRLGPAGETVARLGEIPPPLPTTAPGGELSGTQAAEARCPIALVLAEEALLQTCQPIPGADGHPIGRDILLFDTTRLAELLEDGQRFGPNVRQALLEEASGRRLGVVADADRLELVAAPNDVARQTVYRVPLETPGWELRVAVPDTDILHAVWEQLLWPLVAVGLMALLGTAVVSHALTPLLSRVARQAQLLASNDEELRQAASVFRSAHEAIAITDADQRLIDVNPAFLNLLGYSRDSLSLPISSPIPRPSSDSRE